MFLRTLYYLSQLRKNQWLEKKQLEALQLKKLKSIVSHAYKTVPYYHDLFKKNRIDPLSIRTMADFEKIPVTTKQDLIENFPKRILSSRVSLENCTLEQTSGSCGLALTVARSQKTADYNLAMIQHALFECGLKLSDRLLVFEDPRQFGKGKTFLNSLGFLRKEKASVFDNAETSFEKIVSIKPDVIYGYPSSLFLVAKNMENNSLELGKKPKFIVSTSETLYQKFRQSIEKKFNCSVFDHYGSTEFPRIAWQCREKQFLHINSDSHVVEFLKNGEPVQEENGVVTVTSLYDYDMPLIRYSHSDISSSVFGECPCGRGLPLMNSIEGRSDDFIVDSNGRSISPKVLCYELDELNGIAEYRVSQDTRGKATLFIVKGKNYDQAEIDSSVSRIRKFTANGLAIDVVFTNTLETDGQKKKFRRVFSDVKANF